jgi:molybdopterin-guanine dinucleotide biosynthesis protein A
MEILSSERVGGIVLCGGESTRMGRPKLSLPFGGETMLARVVRILGQVVSPIVVVGAIEQELPALPPEIIVARDAFSKQGPLAGISAGLAALAGRADAAFVSSCDVPLLKAEFIRAMLPALGTHEMAIPHDHDHHHPLAAVYRVSVQRRVVEMIQSGRLRTSLLVEEPDCRLVDVAELRAFDPQLDSLRNVNTPEEYEAALRAAGFPGETADTE